MRPSDTYSMNGGMVRALFGGNCKLCRSGYEPYDLVFPWRGGYVCVPCQRYLNDAFDVVS